MPQKLLDKILKDIKIELGEEFDRNFERKAFFDQPWQPRRRQGKGSILMISGTLRRSIHSTISGNSIRYSSDSDYADIHNAGGTIEVTPKMRKYFWFRYMQANDNKELLPIKGSDAQFWHSMARAKKITIPQRQFIGIHPQVTEITKKVANDCTKEWVDKLFKDFANKLK